VDDAVENPDIHLTDHRFFVDLTHNPAFFEIGSVGQILAQKSRSDHSSVRKCFGTESVGNHTITDKVFLSLCLETFESGDPLFGEEFLKCIVGRGKTGVGAVSFQECQCL